jgi:hypothetical protein
VEVGSASRGWLLLGPVEVASTQGLVSRIEQLARSLEGQISMLCLDELVAAGCLLDPFVLAAALEGRVGSVGIGVVHAVGAGRAASIAAREITALDHLSRGGAGLVLRGSGQRLSEAAAVVSALLTTEVATVEGSLERVVEAPNRPRPVQPPRLEVRSLDEPTGRLERITPAGGTLGILGQRSLENGRLGGGPLEPSAVARLLDPDRVVASLVAP